MWTNQTPPSPPVGKPVCNVHKCFASKNRWSNLRHCHYSAGRYGGAETSEPSVIIEWDGWLVTGSFNSLLVRGQLHRLLSDSPSLCMVAPNWAGSSVRMGMSLSSRASSIHWESQVNRQVFISLRLVDRPNRPDWSRDLCKFKEIWVVFFVFF